MFINSENIVGSPIPVTVATIFRTSPGFPAGLTKDAETSVETPVMYWPLEPTASEPIVSVKDRIKPP